MSNTGLVWTGGPQMKGKMLRIVQQYPGLAGQAAYLEFQIEKTEAQRRTPVKFGVLKASAHVVGPEIASKSITVAIVYGGAAAEYAVPVHENLEAIHPHGQAKYLESVLNESEGHIGPRIVRRIHLDRVTI